MKKEEEEEEASAFGFLVALFDLEHLGGGDFNYLLP